MRERAVCPLVFTTPGAKPPTWMVWASPTMKSTVPLTMERRDGTVLYNSQRNSGYLFPVPHCTMSFPFNSTSFGDGMAISL